MEGVGGLAGNGKWKREVGACVGKLAFKKNSPARVGDGLILPADGFNVIPVFS